MPKKTLKNIKRTLQLYLSRTDHKQMSLQSMALVILWYSVSSILRCHQCIHHINLHCEKRVLKEIKRIFYLLLLFENIISRTAIFRISIYMVCQLLFG